MAGKNTRPKVLEFSDDLGDLSPIPEFKGPKTPSNRQVLRLFLFYFMSLGYQKSDAAKSVVTEVLKKHTTTAVSKTPGRLVDDILKMHKNTRWFRRLSLLSLV